METYATVKGQIVIPAKLRRKYGIKEGTKIVISEAEDAIMLKPLTEQYLKKLQGSLKGRGALKALLEQRRLDKDKE